MLCLKGCGDTCAGRGGDKGECAEGCVAQESRKQKEKHSGASVVLLGKMLGARTRATGTCE